METLKPWFRVFLSHEGEAIKNPLQINLENDDKRWIETII
jgi:hypothetical protein